MFFTFAVPPARPSPPSLLPSGPPPATVPGTSGPPEEEATPSAADVSLMRKALCRGIIESKNNVEVLRKDPNSPLYSVKTFEALQLRPELLQGIYEMGFKLPSKIQETALPTLLANPWVHALLHWNLISLFSTDFNLNYIFTGYCWIDRSYSPPNLVANKVLENEIPDLDY